MKLISGMVVALTVGLLIGCASPKGPPARSPLKLTTGVTASARQHNEEGTRAYLTRQFEEARAQFQLVVSEAPESAEGHYNLGLALFALGQGPESREHFIQAANLAPGDKVIWDSPALRPYGSPEPNNVTEKKDKGYNTQKPAFGATGPRM
jgi:tetratricopeptide (TPR) repeat protein